MPIRCPYFSALQARIAQLSRKFVDDQVQDEQADPVSFQPDLDRLAAFRLLVHAELEEFLESKANEHLESVLAKSRNGQAWMRELPGLLAIAVSFEKPYPNIDLANEVAFSGYVTEVLMAAKRAIKKNNGIKSNSFILLSICAGKALDEVDEFLSNSMNSYGKERGDVAHKSISHSSSLQAPSAESAAVQSLVQQLGAYFDVCS
jgi:hypothetical protein